MSGPLDGGRGDDGHDGHDEVRGVPRIPGPRSAADDLNPAAHRGPAPGSVPIPPPPAKADEPAASAEVYRETPSHSVLKSLLGAWALSACSTEETAAVEAHLGDCAPCAEEALRLRDAVALLHTDRDLDLDPLLRFRVLENCLGRRPARIPVPTWANPYDAESARLDALLRDIGDAEWHAPVRLKWFEGERQVSRRTTVAGVMGHLMSVDGLVASALGLDDPLGPDAPSAPTERTEAFWRTADLPPTRTIREPWRDQSHTLIRTVSFAGRGVAELSVSYGDFALPLRDSMLDRAFECWMHAGDIANAVDYPYEPPSGSHLHRMIDLAARLLPAALADRRRAGLAGPARHLVQAGAPGRSLHLEVEGSGGGNWYIALDSPAAVGSADRSVAQVALDGVEFCRLVAGHVSPEEAAAGQDGDREAIRDVLFAAASLSRL
ncbi:MDMPI N domain containing protein [Streptomyces lunaelactis]|uniref:MDMPI N domain containing protein n=1 Tax=Streptomyces lunaelactis TaxID=1535768 RepID=A0A2R4T3M8_9ACTN|nr:zf-HC2 domain-containing protein [Streptomyces lunaelactis]AVZ73677.1 MDMPI N domain containing protein [Streptomyces lunaelactis]NUK84444.1 zf-HC2 domain-containing protein [Streptomyces lunaelactis]